VAQNKSSERIKKIGVANAKDFVDSESLLSLSQISYNPQSRHAVRDGVKQEGCFSEAKHINQITMTNKRNMLEVLEDNLSVFDASLPMISECRSAEYFSSYSRIDPDKDIDCLKTSMYTHSPSNGLHDLGIQDVVSAEENAMLRESATDQGIVSNQEGVSAQEGAPNLEGVPAQEGASNQEGVSAQEGVSTHAWVATLVDTKTIRPTRSRLHLHVSSPFKEGELWDVLTMKETVITSLEGMHRIGATHTPSVENNCSDYVDDGFEKVLSKHVRKMSNHLMFGPGYSSDNAGDGPRGARFRCPITGRFLKNVSNTRSPLPPKDEPVGIEEKIAEKDLWVFPNPPQDIRAGRNLVCQSRFDSGELWLYQPGVPLHLQDPRKRRDVIVPSVDDEQLTPKLQANQHAQLRVDDNKDNIRDSYLLT
jgi:hypothetical protein